MRDSVLRLLQKYTFRQKIQLFIVQKYILNTRDFSRQIKKRDFLETWSEKRSYLMFKSLKNLEYYQFD
jgi:hypothetical protein